MSPTTIDQQWMDRLVDGELNESERLELLTRLDLEPGAWKRCAVTFLEAQMWQSSFRAAGLRPAIAPSLPAASRGLVPPVLYAAIAASLLTAFTLGWSLGGRQASPALSTEMARDSLGGTDKAGSQDDHGSQNVLNQSKPMQGPILPEGPSATTDSALVKASAREKAGSPAGTATASDHPGKDGKVVASKGLTLPVVREWQRRGYQIEKEPQVVSVTTRDGRKVAVPVDAVRLRFIGDRIY